MLPTDLRDRLLPFDPLQHDGHLLLRCPFPELHPSTSQDEYKLYLSEVSTFSGGQYKGMSGLNFQMIHR